MKKVNHYWEVDKNYSGSFDEKDICVYCGCIRLLGWRRIKGQNHPVRVIKYYLNGEPMPVRPNCTGPVTPSLFDAFAEPNKEEDHGKNTIFG